MIPAIESLPQLAGSPAGTLVLVHGGGRLPCQPCTYSVQHHPKPVSVGTARLTARQNTMPLPECDVRSTDRYLEVVRSLLLTELSGVGRVDCITSLPLVEGGCRSPCVLLPFQCVLEYLPSQPHRQSYTSSTTSNNARPHFDPLA